MKYELVNEERKGIDMRRAMEIWGYINGKIGVKCRDCLRLQEGKCFSRVMTELEQNEQRTCGLFKKKYVWIKRHNHNGEEKVKLKHKY